jgi:hypothetical protein
MNQVLIANISYNPSSWRNPHVNPRAGHKYAQKYPGHESLNFKFNKKGIDTNKYVYGYFQRKYAPVEFEAGGLVIFVSCNTDIREVQIVGIYGKAESLSEETHPMKGFEKNKISINLKAEKEFSMLFPKPLYASNYKESSHKALVSRPGFAYKDIEFAERILFDEIVELSNGGILEAEFEKLVSIYEHYIGKKFKLPFLNKDEREQDEIVTFYKRKTRKWRSNG